MGVAFSGGNIVYTTNIRADTSANLIADIDTAVGSAGWTSKVSITNGFKYTITSPQGLTCKVKLTGSNTSPDGNTCAFLQWLSTDESISGMQHPLIYGSASYAAAGYELVANQCQLFMAPPGVADLTSFGLVERGYSVAGGIPRVDRPSPGTECAASGGGTSTATQIFWSSGEGEFQPDIRTSWYPLGRIDYCLNTTSYVLATDGLNQFSFQLALFPLVPCNNINSGYYEAVGQAKVQKYSNLDPLYIDPLIGWNGRIQGELWDAVVATKDATLDGIITSTSTTSNGSIATGKWVAWNHYLPTDAPTGTYYSTLYLLTGKPTGIIRANYAY